ncbi:ABC transporter permease [Pseudophaeobacter arcticus]|jgi:peptide/nickel transport system permease protein|uniref:ABC transporter permease n=1 Tax=Pseudophaeobacter arcticus TaxID=385492 RepID=UPI00041119EF|nr:ABC transporter permease [Pseudophaeobacter arcticus]
MTHPAVPSTSAPAAALQLWRGADVIQKTAIVIGLLLVFLAIFAPLIAPFDPSSQSLISRLRPPLGFERAKAGYLLGTDELGRDVFSRSLYGLRLTLMLAGLGATLGLLIGGALGLLAGIVGGRTEAGIMAAVDTQIAVPFTLVALFLLAILGSSIEVIVLVLGLAGWEQYARIVRGEVQRLMNMPFIEAARAAGAGSLRIARHHLLPNIVSPIVVQFTLSLSNIVLLESTLSFLGLGVQPPTATLGSMVGIGRDYMPTAPWIVAAPAMMILLITFAVQILGDWLRDGADVRLRKR